VALKATGNPVGITLVAGPVLLSTKPPMRPETVPGVLIGVFGEKPCRSLSKLKKN
jgi:hypothetical protein